MKLEDKVEDNSINEYLRNILEKLNSDEKSSEVIEKVDISDFDDYKSMIEYIKNEIDSLDYICIPSTIILEINSKLKDLNTNFENLYSKNLNNNAQLNSARTEWKNIKSKSFQLLQKITPLKEFVIQKDDIVKKKISDYADSFDDLTKKIDELSENTNSIGTNIQEKNDKIQKMNERIDKLNGQVDEKLESYKNQIDNKQQQIFDEFQDNTKAKFQEIEKESIKYRDEIREFRKIIVEEVSSSEYINSAQIEKKQYRFWRFITMLSMIVFIAITIIFYVLNRNDSWSYVDIASTSIVLIGVGWLIGFSGKLASDHRKNAVKFRKLGIELKTVNPYLDGLNETEKTNIKQNLVENYFPGDKQFDSNYEVVNDIKKLPENHWFVQALKALINN